MTPYILSIVFTLCALGLVFASFKIKLTLPANTPKDDRTYWDKMTKTFRKGFIVGTIGSGTTIIAILIQHAIIAEICCISLLSAMVFPLAILSRKTVFRPCPETVSLQKRWQLILLVGAFFALILTQVVFAYFNMLAIK